MNLIEKECVVFDMEANAKDDAIQQLVEKLFEAGRISSIEKFYEDVKSRERLGATAVGYGIGLPHGKTSNVIYPSICFGRLKQPLIWDEKTFQKAQLILLIAVPEYQNSDIHLKIISTIARKLAREENRKILLQGTETEILAFFNETVII